MDLMKYLAYIIASVFIVVGIGFLMGYFISTAVPAQFRIMMGIVFILYGAFRIISTYFKNDKMN